MKVQRTMDQGAMDSQYFYSLVLLSMISFGTHFCHSSLSIFGAFFIQDHLISTLGLSALFAASFLTSVFLPLCVGYIIDKTQHLKLITASLLLTATLGQVAFVNAICRGDFWMAVIAQVLFGSGAASVSAVQRISICMYLKDNLTFSTGFYVAVAGVSKLLGKIAVGPIAYDLSSYKETMLLPVFLCALSLLCYILFLIKDSDKPTNEETSSSRSRSARERSILSDTVTPIGSEKLSARFYLLAAQHTLYILVFHLLQGFTPHLVTVVWRESIVDAGYIAGISPLLTIFIAPFVGAMSNRYNSMILTISSGAAALAVMGYCLIVFTSLDPILPILLIALAQSVLPTLILASIAAQLTNSKVTGFAFGVIEALDGVANVVGNLVFGYLFSVTNSYFAGLSCLFSLSCIGLCIFIYLYLKDSSMQRNTIVCDKTECVELVGNTDSVDSGTRTTNGEMQRLISDSRNSSANNGYHGIV